MAVATFVAFSSPISAGERTFLPNMLPFPNASGPGDDALLRIATLQPRRPVEQRDERACAGQRAADHRAAQRDRRVRNRVAYPHRLFDDDAGILTARGARGGPRALSAVETYFGINDVVRSFDPGAAGNLHDMPRHAVRGQPLDSRAARHRHRRRFTPDA